MLLKGKHLVVCLVVMLVMMTFAGTGYAKMELVAAHVLAPDHPYQMAFERMAEIVKSKTNGEIIITTHHSAALGEEPQEIEALRMGTIHLTTISAAPLTGFVKEYMACDLPFMFKTVQDAYKFYDGEIGQELFDKTEKIGLIGLAWWDNGFRNFTNNVRPLRKPEDFKGLKMRLMNSPVHMASVRALGGNPVPIDFGELYTAMQQGVVDGQENPVANIFLNRFYEVQKYLSLSKHFYDPSPTFISGKTWEKLTPEQKEIMKEAAVEARDYMRALLNDKEAGMIEELKKEGMEVTYLTEEETEAFQEATKDVWKEFKDDIGEEFLMKFLDKARSI
ncbi:MAG: DctP family TRAP transporter solute-binding subunit [Synergistales bacterium]|nr:DctP family TRAP transporter solute-binding subunit [Synergistales bacterium]